MGHQDTHMDVESQQKSGSQRGRCLDSFLVVSIIFLFVALIAVAAGGMMYMMDLKSRLDSRPLPNLGAPKSTVDPSYPSYKMQNFVYLTAVNNQLWTGNMNLTKVMYGEGTSVGSNFFFNEIQNTLNPQKEGTYFIYIELNFRCTNKCNAGVVSVSVSVNEGDKEDDKLTCKVELPTRNQNETPVSKRCWTVTQMNKEKLHTRMTVPPGFKNWQLELKGSGLGMFLVD